MQYSFDNCQQVIIPYSSQQRGQYFFRTPWKVEVFGVCCEPLKRQVFILIDEADKIGMEATSVVSQVHASFKLHSIRCQNHVDDMSDLVECGCNVTCVPQQYKNWEYYNWNAFLDQ